MTSPPKFTRRLDFRLTALFYECFSWVDMRSAMVFVLDDEFENIASTLKTSSVKCRESTDNYP